MSGSDIQRLKNLASKFDLHEKIHVVDVGANPIGGDAPYQKLLDADLCHVTGFEPQEKAYLELLAQKGPNETYFQKAVGDGGKHSLKVYRSSGFSSLYPLSDETWRAFGFPEGWRRLEAEVDFDTVCLDDMSEIDQIDFLKIDIQGGELAVFQNARKKMSTTIALQSEIRFLPLYDGEPNFVETTAEILDQGFDLHNLVSNNKFIFMNSQRARIHRKSRTQMLDGDIIFIRNLRNLSKFSTLQLKKLALMADGIFGSFDLALSCIDHLASTGACSPDLSGEYFNDIPDWCKINPSKT